MVPAISWALGVITSLLHSTPHPPVSSTPSLEVAIRNGTLRGTTWRHGTQEFFGGVPYASPPSRFERALPAVAYEGGYREAT